MGDVAVIVFREVDETLLLLAEARERAERAAKTVAGDGGPDHVVVALEAVDRELLALHRRLLDETLFHAPVGEAQLALDAS